MLLLLGKGFFMGIFLATYQVGSEALFLHELGEQYLSKAFFATGFLGILSTLVFVYLQKRINFSTLVVTNVFLTFLFMVGMRVAFNITDFDSSIEGFQILPFVMFVMIGPVSAVTLLGFWGLFGRIFDLRASKRIIGGIDTGQLSATIIAFFSIPIITANVPFIDETYDLLFVAALASFGVMFFTFWIARSFNINRATKVDKGAEKPKEIHFLDLMKDPYLRLLSFFLIFSMGAMVFVNYSFYSATEIMYPDQQELTNFLSFFNGTVMILSFIIQSFVNDIIIGRFGLKVALITMPLILILFTIGGIISGHAFGYEVKTETFILFFLFTTSAKAFTHSLRDALENPAFKLFFLPIDIKIRFDIQTRIEGVINEVAKLLAGALQMGLGLLAFFELIHFSYFILGLAGMVIWLSGKLYAQYKVTLRKTLEEQKKELRGTGVRNEHNIINILKEEFKKKDGSRIINALKLLEKLEPIQFEFSLLDHLESRHVEVRKYAYKKLDEYLCFEAIEIVRKEAKTEGDEETLELANKTISHLAEAIEFELSELNVRKLVRSTDYRDRVRAARLLSKATEEKMMPFIMELLRDINPHVRIAAIVTAGKLRRPEFWPVMVENLHLSIYSNAAMSALTMAGEASFHTIDTAFYKTGQYRTTMVRIIQLLGRIGGKEASELLWKKIDFPDKKIVSQILLSLSYIGFKARDFQTARIKLSIESAIGDIAWNIKSLLDIPKETHIDQMIMETFKEEDQQNYLNIFMFLSMIYDAQNVLLVRENIESGTTDSITFGVEMLDVFVEDELKPKLLPVLDELKPEERLAKLINHYPPEDFESHEDLLLQIINRDYNRINRYTKALALYRISQLEGTQVSADLIANLFNPDPLLLQTAAYVIYTIDKNQYHLHSRRLKIAVKKELDRAILPPVFKEENEVFHQKLLLIERVLLLKEVEQFKSIPGVVITELAEKLDEIKIQEGTPLIEEGESGDVPIYILIEGIIDVYKGDERIAEKKRAGILGYERILADDAFEYTALTRNECTVLVLKKENLLDMMSQRVEMIEAFIDIFNNIEIADKEEEYTIADILLSN